MAKLVPDNVAEQTVIRNVTKNIVTCSAPFNRFGLLKFGGRATIVRLTSGALAVFSPITLTPEIQRTIETMGNNVKYITAPDIEHHMHLGQWHDAYPDARLIGPEGVPESKPSPPSGTRKLTFATLFGKGDNSPAATTGARISDEFDADFAYEFVDAHPNKELVFLYRPERTLIEADLLFNLPAREQYSRTGLSPTSGWLNQFVWRAQATSGSAIGQKRFVWYIFSSPDRPAFDRSVARIAAWDFDRIIPCHGDVIETGGKGIFQKVFDWHLKAKST